MSQLVPLSVFVSMNQARKLVKGKPVQLSHSALTQGHNVKMMLHPVNAKKVQRAIKNKKGTRLQLSQSEIDGGSLWDFLKSAGSWIKSNIIDQPFYKSSVKPLVRGLVDVGTSMVPGGVAQDLVKKGSDWIGRETGAFGLKKGKKSRSLKVFNEVKQVDNRDLSRLMPMQHPSMNPVAPHLPPIGGRGAKKSRSASMCPHCGGSFLPAGH